MRAVHIRLRLTNYTTKRILTQQHSALTRSVTHQTRVSDIPSDPKIQNE